MLNISHNWVCYMVLFQFWNPPWWSGQWLRAVGETPLHHVSTADVRQFPPYLVPLQQGLHHSLLGVSDKKCSPLLFSFSFCYPPIPDCRFESHSADSTHLKNITKTWKQSGVDLFPPPLANNLTSCYLGYRVAAAAGASVWTTAHPKRTWPHRWPPRG